MPFAETDRVEADVDLIDALSAFDDDFDPLAVDDFDIDQDDIEDENPYDTIDYPTLRNMPAGAVREGVFTAERAGSAEAALKSLLDYNPARRPVLLAVIDLCRDGAPASVVSAAVDELQKDNRSVYTPMTLCRMLERAGALSLEMPEVSVPRESAADGVEYLEIAEHVDPIWRATETGLAVHAELTNGASFRDIVLSRDVRYLEVYAAVMRAVAESPLSRNEIGQIVDGFEIVQSPRRFGEHFIDMLERTDALVWRDRSWQLTDLGRALLPEVEEALAAGADRQEGARPATADGRR